MKINPFLPVIIFFVFSSQQVLAKSRARDLNIPFDGKTGTLNAITDVSGVEVGLKTLVRATGDHAIRTGVTAVLPMGKTKSKVPAAIFSLNGNGELTGSHWVEESGFLEGPVMLTNTYSVGVVRDAVVKWGNLHFPNPNPNVDDAFTLPVVAETYDGILNDIKSHAVTKQDAFSALDNATGGPVAEGAVGGGVGMMCMEFKCGTGTASRVIRLNDKNYTVGILVQANFGDRKELMVRGAAVGKQITDLKPKMGKAPQGEKRKDGSIIVVVATDIPLLPHQLKRLARRPSMGIARVGGIAHNSSGDIFLAFSTASPSIVNNLETWQSLPNESITEVFEAVVDATEEAILNSLVAGETMVGVEGNTVYGIPHGRLTKAMKSINGTK